MNESFDLLTELCLVESITIFSLYIAYTICIYIVFYFFIITLDGVEEIALFIILINKFIVFIEQGITLGLIRIMIDLINSTFDCFIPWILMLLFLNKRSICVRVVLS